MRYRLLGRTGLLISELSFGAGPVAGLMTGDDRERQAAVLGQALKLGINWIDTAPGYGEGRSEVNIGRALREITSTREVHVASKVRLSPEHLHDIRGAVRRSLEDSLKRLGLPSITLLQLHNGLTAQRSAEPFSLSPNDVFGGQGIAAAFAELREAGLVRCLGLTGTGQPEALHEVVRSGCFDTIQVPYNLLNPSAGEAVPAGVDGSDYAQIIATSAAQQMGVLAIRVFAGGALLDQEPSAHTLTTPFFPLAQYQRDRARTRSLTNSAASIKERAVRFVLADRRVHSALIGFSSGAQVEELTRLVTSGSFGHINDNA